MLFWGYVAGIICVCIIFIIRFLGAKWRRKLSLKKWIREYLVVVVLLGAIVIIALSMLFYNWKIQMLKNEYTNLKLYIQEIYGEEKNNEIRLPNTGIDTGVEEDQMEEQLDLMEEKINDLNDKIDNLDNSMDELRETTEKENQSQDVELFLTGFGTIIIPVILFFFNLFSDEIKKFFKKKNGEKDIKTEAIINDVEKKR